MPMTVRPGENVEIYCDVTGSAPIEVRWHAENFRPLPRSVSVNGRHLRFNSIRPSDAGRYFCSAANPHGNVTKTAEVIVGLNEVVSRPHGVDDVSVHEALEGGTVSLRCTHEHAPRGTLVSVFCLFSSSYAMSTLPQKSIPPQYNWRREYGELPATATLANHNQLMLNNVHPDDAGRYICQMTVPSGSVSHKHVDLVVRREYAQRRRRQPLRRRRHHNTELGDRLGVEN